MTIYFTTQDGITLKYTYLDYTYEDAERCVEDLESIWGKGTSEIVPETVH